jgi:hypothetical protein
MKRVMQRVFCQICGTDFLTDFNSRGGCMGGRVCSKECMIELGWLKALIITDSEYYPNPNPNGDNKPNI